MSLVKRLAELLRNQIAAYTEFNALLQREHDALETRDPDGLERCRTERENLVARLEDYDQQFRNLFAQVNIAAVPNGMRLIIQTLPNDARHQIASLWEQLIAIATECRGRNTVNGKIVEISRLNTERVLKILLGQNTAPASTYAANGKVANANTKATIATA